MAKIIIVEDDKNIREELYTFLQRNGYSAEKPEDFSNIIDYIRTGDADLVLLDINLPMFDGYYVCREIRKISDVPIIIVTSRNSDIDELMSMNVGADDFITKPYNVQILLARIEAVLKRCRISNNQNDVLKYNGMEVNVLSGTVSFNNESIEVTKNEMKILSYLIKNKGRIVSRESIMAYLWDCEMFVDDNTLSVNMTRIRKKLESIGISNLIDTRRGLGYIIS